MMLAVNRTTHVVEGYGPIISLAPGCDIVTVPDDFKLPAGVHTYVNGKLTRIHPTSMLASLVKQITGKL